MSTLVLNANSGSPITVVCQRAGKGVPRRVGSKTYSFAGAERSSVRGQAKVIPITTSYVDTATEALIQNAGYNGAALPCSGDILGNIQTVCSFENVVSNMMPGLPGFFEMSFTLNEVQASVVLLKYSPGDVITGESFTRSTTATYIDAAGLVQTAAINAKRDGHYIAGVRSLLLEDTRTNRVLWSHDLTNAAWTKRGTVAVSMTSTGPDGVSNSATSITGLGAPGTNDVFQSVSGFGANARLEPSFWIKKGSASGTIDLRNAQSVALGQWSINLALLGAGWEKITRSHPAVTIVTDHLATAGGAAGPQLSCTAGAPVAFNVWGETHETGAFSSSTIPTTTVAVTRAADSYSLPFTTPPQEMTVYAKFVEGGTLQTVSARVMEIASAADAAPRFILFSSGNFYETFHDTVSSTAASVQAIAPVIGNTVELGGRLFGSDGSVDSMQSINGAAVTTAAQSGVNGLATGWSGLLCWLNSGGSTNTGFTALQSFKICAGARSLSEMRNA